MFIEELEGISFHEHYLSLLYFMKYYRSEIDTKIKKRLRIAYKDRIIDVEEFKKRVRRKFHKYTKKDYALFLRKSKYFFSLFIYPFNLKKLKNNDYLNRVYLGLGFEFLLKAIFLKKGYIINKIHKKGLNHPVRLGTLTRKFLDGKIYELGYFIDLLPKIKPKKVDIRDFNYYVIFGLIVTQIWRNQDIHTPTGLFEIDNVQWYALQSSYNSLYKLFLPRHPIPKFPSN